jgi:hypothetical protein
MPYGKISTMIQKDLIIIGEWMAPIILKNTGRRLAEYKSNLSDYTGFWNAVSCVDINNDGKKDLILEIRNKYNIQSIKGKSNAIICK